MTLLYGCQVWLSSFDMSSSAAIQKLFISSPKFAVLGASIDRSKYGNKVLRFYQQHELEVIPVNPVRLLPPQGSNDYHAKFRVMIESRGNRKSQDGRNP
jgi:CoA binding domain